MVGIAIKNPSASQAQARPIRKIYLEKVITKKDQLRGCQSATNQIIQENKVDSPCGDRNDYQSVVDSRPELRGYPITISVSQFCLLYGLGKTTTHKLINEGKLEVAKVGRRTLITLESAEALIASSIIERGS